MGKKLLKITLTLAKRPLQDPSGILPRERTIKGRGYSPSALYRRKTSKAERDIYYIKNFHAKRVRKR
jgi:hypothetical protein